MTSHLTARGIGGAFSDFCIFGGLAFDERDAKYVKKKIMNVIYSQPFIFFKISAFFSRSSRFQRSLLPERGLENLSRGALFGVIVVAIKKVSKHSLVGWNVCSFPTVYRV